MCYNKCMELKKITTLKKVEALHQMGIDSVEEVLTHYPFRYVLHEQKPISEWKEKDKIFTCGVVSSTARVMRFQGQRSVTRFSMIIEEEEFQCSIFNRPWTNAFPMGKVLTIEGVYQGNYKITLINANSQPLEEQMGLIPVYSTSSSISQKQWSQIVDKALAVSLESLEDRIPESYRLKYKLLKRREALYFIHKPKSEMALKQALRTLKYEEFLMFQCCMQSSYLENMKDTGISKQFSNEDVYEVVRNLSFDLTDDQKKAVDEILHDLHSSRCMMRLLQGDVGCGKTLVAALAGYGCILAHQQVALMAPTEILAKQHYASLSKLFEGFDVHIALYCSSLKKSEKKEILEDLKAHRIHFLIGTHALFQDDVVYDDLGLVITDEQHRFGVEQRRKLLGKGKKVDMLLMSATPIPRTLATTLYGDLDVSTIEQYPKGRSQTITRYVPTKTMKPILSEILDAIEKGIQCYVVCPSIEENEDMKMHNVTSIYEGMRKTLKNVRIGLLHGQMKSEEKDQVMEDFLAHRLDVLVSTTVIEVGVDVSNANRMVIYDAHRFGLSQIHQLRGRVGRGNETGICYLLSDTKEEESIARLKKLEETNDGFEIARFDLMNRGPGDILGKRQSGLPSFILGDCVQDSNILMQAKQDAMEIVSHLRDYPALEKLCMKYINENKYVD